MTGDEAKITPVLLVEEMGKHSRPMTGLRFPNPLLKALLPQSMFQDTVIKSLAFGSPVIVCSEKKFVFVQAELESINVKPRAIILEPENKGGASALALAAFYLKNLGEKMLVMPTNYYIENNESFEDCVELSASHAHDHIVFIGAPAHRNLAGSGYIKHMSGSKEDGVYQVQNFIEKADARTFRTLRQEGAYLLHTGIFLARPRVFLRLLREHHRELYKHTERSFYAAQNHNEIYRVQGDNYSRVKPLSVGRAIAQGVVGAYVSVLEGSDGGTRVLPKVIRRKIRSIIK